MPSDNRFLTSLRLELAYFSGLPWLRGRRDRRRRRHPAVRARASAARRALSAAQIPRNHARISRSNDPGAEALEIRHRLDGRGLPAGGHAGLATAVCLPDLRRRLQGSDRHRPIRCCRDTACRSRSTCRRRFRTASARPGGWRWKQVIARENRISLVMDRKERRFDIASTSEKYQLYEFLEGWMRSLAPPDLSAAIKDLCTRYSVDLAALSREASMDWDDLAKLAADPQGDDRKRDGELSGAVEPEGCRCAARDDDGQGGGAGRVPPRRQAFRLSVRRSRIISPAACRDGRGGRLCQRGVGDTGRRRERRAEPICTRCRASPGTDGSVRCAPCA